ncbi:MAG: hypothetical protein LBL93_03275 [Ruminococcus sp.]|jgi:hypothetical protein|nr:hypothetical protein [Ruminococcus sp.]
MILIEKYNGKLSVDDAMKTDDPLIALIAFDKKIAIIKHCYEEIDNKILLQRYNVKAADTDNFFRILFNKDSADWAFNCPLDYKNITEEIRRVTVYYKDGLRIIAEFLSEIGYFSEIRIPERYSSQIRKISR